MSLDVSTATHLWIDAGAMSGPPEERHQVELGGELVRFFDEASRAAQEVLIRPPLGAAVRRPLSFRGHRHSYVDIWRLGLPTKAMGGVDYAGQALHFERSKAGGQTIYLLDVAERDSARAKWWRRQAERDGVTGATQGGAGRDYGYW